MRQVSLRALGVIRTLSNSHLLLAVGLVTMSAAGSAQGVVSSSRSAGGFMVPAAVTLRATTKAEDEAHAVWTLRAALNVAALQCQFSPFLRTVANYNETLRHHTTELARAQTTMVGHFRRYDGARGTNSFDQYNTRTYNSFSTLDAQYAFCEMAGTVGREVLRVPRGQLGKTALMLNSMLRGSLGQPPVRILFDPSQVTWIWLATLPPVEPDQKGRRNRRA